MSQSARAEERRYGCPDYDHGSNVTPATFAPLQATCWYDKYRKRDAICGNLADPHNTCVMQATLWCDKGNLDQLPGRDIEHSCIAANLTKRDFRKAKELLSLTKWSPQPTLKKCRDALGNATVTLVVPPGASVKIDSLPYETVQKGRLTKTLPEGWWNQHVTVVMGGQSKPFEVTKSIVDSFNPYECTFRQIEFNDSPPPPPPIGRIVAYGGGAIFSSVVAAYLWTRRDHELNQVSADCDNDKRKPVHCSNPVKLHNAQGATDRAKLYEFAFFAFGAGGVALATASLATWWTYHRSQHVRDSRSLSHTSDIHVQPLLGPGFATLGISGEF